MGTNAQTATFRKDSNGVYRCLPFEKLTWLDHGFSTRSTIALPASVTTLRQIHSSLVCDARGLADRGSEGDALVSDVPRQVVGVRTADCVPVLLVDPRSRAVAAVHAGWRGTAAKIVQRTVERMFELFRTDPRDIHAAIGPAIGVCCYRVGLEVAVQFRDLLPGLLLDGPSGVPLDLPDANRRSLSAAGVPDTQIHNLGLCTFCGSGDFFSYRRNQSDPGRMISFISRRN